jgi:hypothetical protein
MTVDESRLVPAQPAATVGVEDLVATLRPRLDGVAPPEDIEVLVRQAHAELGAVKVSTYLPILVERSISKQLRSTD